MTKIKVILILIIFIIFGGSIWFFQNKINSLEEINLKNQIIITQQDDKIKELLTEINLLKSDLEIKKISLDSLQQTISEKNSHNDELIKNLQELSKIEPEKCNRQHIDDPVIVDTNQIFEIIHEETKTIEKQEVTSNENGKKFIIIRNNIYSNYR